MRRFALLYFSFCCFLLSSQEDPVKQKRIDSLTAKLSKDSAHIFRFQELRPYVNFDGRNSFIEGKPVTFKGFQLGGIADEKHTVSLGFYSITQNSKKPYAATDGTLSIQKSLSMHYITIFYMYALIEKKHFELDIPIEMGLGGYKITFHDSLNTHVNKEVQGAFIPIGVGIQPIYKPVRWVGMSLLLGYRVALERNPNENFNGFYSALGISLDIRQIIRDIRYSSKKKKYKHAVQVIINE